MIDVKERIGELLEERNMSRYELSKKSGVPLSTISSIFYRETIPQFDTVYKLCEGLNVSMAYFNKELDFDKVECMSDENLIKAYESMGQAEKMSVTNYVKHIIRGRSIR